MKTITKAEINLKEEDKKLIFSKMPKNPCDTCNSYLACPSGCKDRRKYETKINHLKKQGIFELVIKANEYYKIEQEIKKLNERKRELKVEFSELGLDISQIFDCME